jgi:hypothetical protein
VPRPDLVLVVELLVFVGFAFAVISSLHSYLIAADQTGTVRPPPRSRPHNPIFPELSLTSFGGQLRFDDTRNIGLNDGQ